MTYPEPENTILCRDKIPFDSEIGLEKMLQFCYIVGLSSEISGRN